MTSIVHLQRYFDDGHKRRGQEYFEARRVNLLRCEDAHVEALVRGTDTYGVIFRRKNSKWSMKCSCPAFEQDGACKHAWATLLAALAQMGLEAPERATGPVKSGDELETQLRSLESAEHEDVHESDVEVRYVLHSFARGPEEWSVMRFLVARKSGARALKFREAHPALKDQHHLSVADQRILTMLPPAGWSWRTVEAGPASREIPRVLEAPVLELAARTGRLYLGEEQNVGTNPVLFDEGPPWVLALSLRRDGENVVLSGHLERGEERMTLARCQRVLAGGVVIARNMLAPADWRGAWAWVPTLRRAGEIRAPVEQVHRLLSALRTVPGDPVVDAREFVEELPRDAQGIVQVDPPLHPDGALRATLLFKYGDVRCRAEDPARSSFVQRGERLLHLERDAAREKDLRAEFFAAGGRAEIVDTGIEKLWIEADVLPALVSDLSARGWIVEAEGSRVRVAGGSNTGVKSGIDWFDLETTIDFEGISTELPDLLRAVRDRSRFVRLSDGSVGILTEAWLKRWRLASSLGSVHGGKLRLARSQAWILDAWLAEATEAIDVDAKFLSVREGLRRCAEPTERPEPRGFHGELRPYQREGLGWMHFLAEAGVGGILADDMGLGKTVQVLALLVERRAKARGPALVVAPLSVLFNWEREAQRFTPGLVCVLHHGAQRAKKAARIEDADIVVTSYGTLRMDAGMLKEIQFDCAVLDEAQAIKNDKSLAAKAARLLKADLRLALSGTPVENHLGELASILRYTNPGLIEGSKALAGVLSGPRGDVATARVVARAVRPFLLRRTKEAVAQDLPSKTEQVVAVELSAPERRAYEEMRKRLAAEILQMEEELGLERIGLRVLEAMLRLRQAACHPGLLDPARVDEGSAKLDTLLDRVEEVVASGHKALVFSQFTSFLAIVRARLDARGIRYEYLDGKTRKRDEKVDSFQNDPTIPLFLVSLKAGGAGLNLTAADYVFLLDPWWNPAVEAQAIDRTHRIGQTRPVTAYRLITRGTIEDKVSELQERKRELANALFDGGGTSLRDMSRADLAWLFA